jgi:hypothetical protein
MKETRLLFWIGLAIGLAILTSGCTLEIVDPAPPAEIALQSFHGRYVTALGEGEDWKLSQTTELGDCGWFTLSYLANGKVTLKTCHNRYVTAPASDTETIDWMITQEIKLGRCGQFDLYKLGSDRIALKTCANRFLTAGDGYWPGELAWSVVGEMEDLMDWEKLTMLELQQTIEP